MGMISASELMWECPSTQPRAWLLAGMCSLTISALASLLHVCKPSTPMLKWQRFHQEPNALSWYCRQIRWAEARKGQCGGIDVLVTQHAFDVQARA